MLKPLSITIVIPSVRGLGLRSGICVKLKFILMAISGAAKFKEQQ